MSSENVDVVRRLFNAVRRRDTGTVYSLYDRDFEWDGTRTRWAEVVPVNPRFVGHEGLRRFSRHYYEMWEELHDEIDELIDAGEHVVSVVTTRGRGRTSGLDVELPGHSAVWTVRGAKIVRVVWFPTRREAVEAAGLPE